MTYHQRLRPTGRSPDDRLSAPIPTSRELADGGLYKLTVVPPPYGTGVLGRNASQAGLPYLAGVCSPPSRTAAT